MDDFERTNDTFDRVVDVPRKTRNQILKGFEDMSKEQDNFASKNGVLDVYG